MFAGTNLIISGGSFSMQGEFHTHTYVNDGERAGLKLLQSNLAPGAFHNSSERYDPPKCHPRTRKAVLSMIVNWIKQLSDSLSSDSQVARQHFFLWLYGPAGAGKSAIAQSIAELCEELKLLAASFFFSRNIPDRNNKAKLVSTLVYQMIMVIPEMREAVITAIEFNPQIFNMSLEAQVKKLIVEPLNYVLENSATDLMPGIHNRPRLIIIDGLDECNSQEAQSYILEVLVKTLIPGIRKTVRFPFIFLVASRPEQQIRDVFNDPDILSEITTTIVLDDTYKPDADIEILLEAKFNEIKRKHPSRARLPKEWPDKRATQQLVSKSSGQFIYAVTVMKYIESRRHLPTERLEVVLGLSEPGNDTPFAELDALYTHILTSMYDSDKVKKLFIVLLLVGSDLNKTPRDIEEFLFLKPGEIDIILSDLHSLIAVPDLEDVKTPLRMSHASLGDFLLDKSRSGKFWIELGTAHAEVSLLALKHMEIEKENNRRYYNHCQIFWTHCDKASPMHRGLMDYLYHSFDLNGLLDWMIRDGWPNPDAVRPERYWSKVSVDGRWPNTSKTFWALKKLKHPDPEINFDMHLQDIIGNWMHTQLSLYYPYFDPSFFHVLTAATLPYFSSTSQSSNRVYDIIHDIKPFADIDTLKWKDPLRLADHYSDEPHSPWYYHTIRGWLRDQKRAREYYIDEKRYADFMDVVLEYFFKQDLQSVARSDAPEYSIRQLKAPLELVMSPPVLEEAAKCSDSKNKRQANSRALRQAVGSDHPLFGAMIEVADKIDLLSDRYQ